MIFDTLVIGGGASGIMAAIYAARAGAQVALIEKNEKLGKKIYITGKGRCNVTNMCDLEELPKNIVKNPKFMYSALGLLNNQGMYDLLTSLGLKLKIERGQRVFPESDKASDVTNTLERELKRLGVQIILNLQAAGLIINNGAVNGVKTNMGDILAKTVILATGGLSYPSTGSTGDGHKMLNELGVLITNTRPALTPIETVEKWPTRLSGLTLKNVSVNVKKPKFSMQGEMLFTHFGVSGPLILSLSSYLPDENKGLVFTIDLKPALSHEQLDNRLLREFAVSQNKYIQSVMDTLVPHQLGLEILGLIKIPGYKKVNSITKEERTLLCDTLKALPLTVNSLRGFNEAIITRGGVSVKEINPSTMAVKKIAGLYACGELADVDALTGGFNLQIAFSTGALAGKSAAMYAKEPQ